MPSKHILKEDLSAGCQVEADLMQRVTEEERRARQTCGSLSLGLVSNTTLPNSIPADPSLIFPSDLLPYIITRIKGKKHE